jgi:hypothetical protein
MDNPPLDHGLSLTLSWGSREARARRSLPLGMALRVGLGLALCAACYEAGRWHGSLEAQAERSSARVVAAVRAVKAAPSEELRAGGTGMAPGQALGVSEPMDVITPLNVRDPSALVMGPGATEAPRISPVAPPAAQPESDEAPPSPPARVFPRPSAKVKPDPRF